MYLLLSYIDHDEVVHEPETEELVWKTMEILQPPNHNTVIFQFNSKDFYCEERASIENQIIVFEESKRFLTDREDYIALLRALINSPESEGIKKLLSKNDNDESLYNHISIYHITIEKLEQRSYRYRAFIK